MAIVGNVSLGHLFALSFRFILGFVLLTAAIPKMVDRHEFQRAVRNYALLPTGSVGLVAAWLPRLELVFGVALLLGAFVTPVATLSALMLLTFSAAVVANLVRGRRIDCGCRGSVAPREIGWWLVVGDLALAGMAVFTAIAAPSVLVIASGWGSAREASATQGEALALLMLGGIAVIAHYLVSSWIKLQSIGRSVRRGLGGEAE
jgi:hypothetical protein